MAIICWGGLGKAANDSTTIDEEITEYIRLHDENLNAHMGEDYSLGVHRLQNVLDHAANSVYPSHVNSDISFIKQVSLTANVDVVALPTWTELTELELNFTSSRVGRLLLMAHIYIQSSGEGEDFYLRFKVTKGEAVTYYPSADGLIYWELRDIAVDHWGQFILPQVIDLAADTYKIEIECADDGTALGNVVSGTPAYKASKLLIQSVGTAIVET